MAHPTAVPNLNVTEWKKLWRSTPGSSSDRCVTVGREHDVRSGAFIAGNFVDFIRAWDGALQNSKLYYIPLYPPKVVPGHFSDIPLPTIMAQRLDIDAQPITPAQFLNAAWAMNGMFFYPSGTVLPERGAWRLTVSQGRNHGCFELVL